MNGAREKKIKFPSAAAGVVLGKQRGGITACGFASRPAIVSRREFTSEFLQAATSRMHDHVLINRISKEERNR